MGFVALGFLRTDVSRQHRSWYAAQVRCLARRLGYDLSGTIALGHSGDPVRHLLDTVARVNAEAVVVPSADHFADRVIPAALVEITDVITVAPEYTYARWATGELPVLSTP
ncbi:hypothetical protein BJY24_004944 [Nocardia transvalensis]|uniref:Uncharacterized protein n=1 Tax=Nocardia transvalensis TaxID=37333 RepID=A0A7W9PH89_9NOCA|nr:hypothetical protein [Nocardia transvalensis]MBB5916032.1 hypothetical protein [Nocardia transvalensis]